MNALSRNAKRTLGKTNDGVNEDVRLLLASGTNGELAVSAVPE